MDAAKLQSHGLLPLRGPDEIQLVEGLVVGDERHRRHRRARISDRDLADDRGNGPRLRRRSRRHGARGAGNLPDRRGPQHRRRNDRAGRHGEPAQARKQVAELPVRQQRPKQIGAQRAEKEQARGPPLRAARTRHGDDGNHDERPAQFRRSRHQVLKERPPAPERHDEIVGGLRQPNDDKRQSDQIPRRAEADSDRRRRERIGPRLAAPKRQGPNRIGRQQVAKKAPLVQHPGREQGAEGGGSLGPREAVAAQERPERGGDDGSERQVDERRPQQTLHRRRAGERQRGGQGRGLRPKLPDRAEDRDRQQAEIEPVDPERVGGRLGATGGGRQRQMIKRRERRNRAVGRVAPHPGPIAGTQEVAVSPGDLQMVGLVPRRRTDRGAPRRRQRQSLPGQEYCQAGRRPVEDLAAPTAEFVSRHGAAHFTISARRGEPPSRHLI